MTRIIREMSAIALAALFLLSSSSSSSAAAFGGEIPRFVVEPESVVAKAGSPIDLFCSVHQNSTEVTWLLNGSVVTAQRPRDVELRDGTLVISAFDEAEHVGAYRCLVSGTFGAVVSQEASVESAVLYSTDASETVAEIAVVKGNAAVVPCYPPFSRPQADIEFELNGTRLVLGGRHLILPSGNLQISNVSHADGGSYRCSAYNRVLSRRLLSSVVQRLTVVSPLSNVTPSFIWSSRDFVTVVLGQNLTLECAADGWPVPELTWEKYGGHLPTGRFSYLLGNLVIDHVQRFDAGTYLCRATNGIGQPQAKVVSVEILERPVIEMPPVGQNVTQGSTVQLVCGARGAPKVSTQWLHNAKPMPTTDQFITIRDSTLILTNVKRSQSGVYQCVVRNGLGADQASASLTVVESTPGTTTVEDDDDDDDDDDSAERLRPDRKPEDVDAGGEHFRHRGHLAAPSKPEIEKLSNSSVLVQWTADAPSGGHVITGFKVQSKELLDDGSPGPWRTAAEEIPAQRRTHRLLRLRPGGVYRFRVGSVFSNGESKYGRSSNRVAMASGPGPSPGPGPGAVGDPRPGAAAPPAPLIVELRPLSSSEIFIGWHQLESDQWPIDGFYIFYSPQGESSSEYQKKVVKGTSVRHAVLSHLSPGTSYQIQMQTHSSIAGDSRLSDALLKDTMGHSGDALPSDHGAGGSGKSFAIHSSDLPLENDSNERRKKEGEDAADWGADNASATTTEGQLLYVALGVVFGLVALVTVVCIVVCMVKQHRQQQRLSGAKEEEEEEEEEKPRPTVVFLDAASLRPRAAAAAGGAGGVGPGASADPQQQQQQQGSTTRDSGHDACDGSCGGTGSNERSAIRTECFALSGRPHERKMLLPELLLPPPPPLSNNSTPKKYSSCHGDRDSDASLPSQQKAVSCSNHTYSKLHGPHSSSSSSDRQPSKDRATAVVSYGSCGRRAPPVQATAPDDHIPRSYEQQQQQQQQQQQPSYADHVHRSQGGAGGRPSPHHRLHGQHPGLKSGYHGNQGWRREEIPIEEENSMRDQSTNTNFLISRDTAQRVYSDDDDDEDGVYSSVAVDGGGGGASCVSLPPAAAAIGPAQPRNFIHDDRLGFALRSGVCYQGNGYHSSGIGGDHLDSRCDAGHQTRFPGRPGQTTTIATDDARRHNTGHVTTDSNFGNLATQQQQQQQWMPSYLGYRGDVGYQ